MLVQVSYMYLNIASAKKNDKSRQAVADVCVTTSIHCHTVYLVIFVYYVEENKYESDWRRQQYR